MNNQTKIILIVVVGVVSSCVLSSVLGGSITWFWKDISTMFGFENSSPQSKSQEKSPSGESPSGESPRNEAPRNEAPSRLGFTESLLKHAETQKCLDGNGSTVYYNDCNSSNPFMKWSYNGKTIQQKGSGKCLKANTDNSVTLDTCSNTASDMQWLHDKNTFKLNGTNNCLYSGGTNTIVYEPCDVTNNRFLYFKQ